MQLHLGTCNLLVNSSSLGGASIIEDYFVKPFSIFLHKDKQYFTFIKSTYIYEFILK